MTTTASAIRKDQLFVRREGTVRTARGRSFGLPCWLTVLYLALEYGRPQDSFPGVGSLHLPAIITVSLGFALVTSGHVRLSDIQTKLFMGFLGLMAALVPFAVNNHWAFYSTVSMLITFVAYLAIVNFVDSFRKFETLVHAWIIIHIYLAVTGILKGGLGIGGFLEDENDFALVLNMIIPFSFFLALEARGSKRLLYLIVTGIFVVCDVTTLSRGGFVGLVAVGLYCWLRSPRKPPRKLMSAAVLVLLLLAVEYLAPQRFWERMGTIEEETQGTGTGQERIYSWKIGWEMFLDNPILGVGAGNFNWNFARYESGEGFAGRLHGGRAAHSLYFTLMPELGTVGTVLYAWMLLSSLKDLRFIRKWIREQPHQSEEDRYFPQRVRYLTLALGGSLVGFLVSGTFLSVLFYPNFWLWMAMVVALRRLVISSVLSTAPASVSIGKALIPGSTP